MTSTVGGYMESLDNKWILSSGLDDVDKCSDKDSNSPATLGLDNMRGVFILVITLTKPILVITPPPLPPSPQKMQ